MDPKIDAPLRRLLPNTLAVVLTFAVCGAVHDLVTTTVRGSIALIFTPWFVCLGAGVALGSSLGMNLSRQPWIVRSGIHLTYLVACLVVSVGVRRLLGLP